MIVVYLVILLFTILLSKSMFKTLKNPMAVFDIIWCIVGAVSNIGLYDYYLPSFTVNVIIILGILISSVAFLCTMNHMPRLIFCEKVQIEETSINVRILYIVNIVCIVAIIPTFFKSLQILQSGQGFWYIRANVNSLFSNGILATITNNVIYPVFTTTSIISVLGFFIDTKKSTKFIVLILAIIENTIIVIMTAGRTNVVNYLMFFLICMVMFRGDVLYRFIIRQWKKILFALMIVGLLFVLTNLRDSSGVEMRDIIKSIYVYYFSGPSYLTQLLQNVTSYGPGADLFYGAATFGFITNFVYMLIIFFTGIPQGPVYVIGSVITNNQLSVGLSTRLNAMYTVFYPFLLDWGYAGALIGPICLGVISGIITKKFYLKRNIRNAVIYIYWINVLIRSVFKWYLLDIDIVVIFVLMNLYTGNNIFAIRRKQ